MKNFIVVGIVAILLGGAYFLLHDSPEVAEFLDNNGGASGNELSAVASAISGRWQSTEDESFVREFRANGSIVDTYTGETVASSTGAWSVFTGNNPNAELPLEADTIYLAILMDNEPLYFSVEEADEDSLVLIYLNRGGTLEFERINNVQ
jgi:hypothetical protein